MEGNISLKKFIFGVKRELQEASVEGSGNPFLELTQVELEAEFGLETSGGVEGGFSFFVKATADAGASQSHRVKLIFSPIKNNIMFAVSPPESTDQVTGETTYQLPSNSAKPSPQTPRGPYFSVLPDFQFAPKINVDEIVKKAISEAMRELDAKDNSNRGSGEDGA